MDPTRRLLFWLRVPYAADIALVLIGIGLLVAGESVGWWVLVFAGVRAVIGTVALVYVLRRMLAPQPPATTPAATTGPPASGRPD